MYSKLEVHSQDSGGSTSVSNTNVPGGVNEQFNSRHQAPSEKRGLFRPSSHPVVQQERSNVDETKVGVGQASENISGRAKPATEKPSLNIGGERKGNTPSGQGSNIDPKRSERGKGQSSKKGNEGTAENTGPSGLTTDRALHGGKRESNTSGGVSPPGIPTRGRQQQPNPVSGLTDTTGKPEEK